MAAELEWLLDTSILIDVLRGYKPAQAWIDSLPDDARWVSVITAAELLAGCRNQSEQRRVERELALYSMLWIDEEISKTALDLYRQFHLSHGAGFFDCLIAATSRSHGLQLATLNTRHFAPFPQLKPQRPY